MPKVYKATGKASDVPEGTYFFECPGCGCLHSFKHPPWYFNGDKERPTVTPSILVNGNSACINPTAKRCHSFITDGKIRFLDDCEHELKGQTVELGDTNE